MDEPFDDLKKFRADAQVGSVVVPRSKIESAGIVASGTLDEGRCPIDPTPTAKKKRPTPLSIRASASQRAAIKARAAEAGLSVNQFLLFLACGPDLVPIRPSKEDRLQRAAALRAIRGTGTLLNQMTRHLNSGRIVGAVKLSEAIKRHEENTAAMLAAFIKGAP